MVKAARFSRFGGPEVLEIVELPDPHPGRGEVRIAVRAAGVNPSDWKKRAGLMDPELPQTLGHEAAGVVDEVGDGVAGVAVGDRVFGFDTEGAAQSELAVLSSFAPIPPSLGFADAAALPAAVETATRAIDQLGVGNGSTLLVNGASGSVGSAAVQLAVARGARVIGTASPANRDYLRGLGAEPVAYGEGLVERVRALCPDGVDRALDVAGSGVLPELIGLAGGAGHVVTLADFEGAQTHGVTFSRGDAGRALHALAEIGELVESGRFSLPVARTFPLAEIAEAHRAGENGHLRGKIVLLVDAPLDPPRATTRQRAMSEVEDVVWMVRGAWVTLCLRATCELGIVEALDEPRSLHDLAARTASDPATLARLLRVLVDLELLSLRDDGRFATTARGDVLGVEHPSGVRSLALMQTTLPNLTAWQQLAAAVRRGEAVFESLHGVTPWDWLASRPEEEAIFNASMARRASLQVAAVRAARDFSGASLVVDVGGGEGALLTELLADESSLHGIVADRPEVAAAASARFAAAGLGDRARGEPVDFFTTVPTGGDVYILSNVLHDWDDPEALTILRAVHEAMGEGAHLLVVENVLDAPGRTSSQQRDVHLVDLHMLVMFGARERTRQEYDDLLVDSGFRAAAIAPSPNTWQVMETQPATWRGPAPGLSSG